MSTVGRMVFRTCLLANGFFGGRRAFSLWSYTNRAELEAFMICWHVGEEIAFRRSQSCLKQVLFWTAKDGYTDPGKKFLAGDDSAETGAQWR